MKIKVGLIGFGRMGQMYWEEMQKSGRWDIAYICDTDPASRELARNLSPSSRIISDEQEIFDDQSVEAVGLFALANSRKEQIEKAVRSNKHILTEKPIADTIDKEWEIVDLIEKYDRIAAVNLYLRNSWYHQAMKQFIDEGEIGDDANWCGHPFSQANWYAFGRLAWNPALTAEEIAHEWLCRSLQ
jgi:myo-inositol 2-dehydrogenase/D-chiro-inositol 1-dehydrogenase